MGTLEKKVRKKIKEVKKKNTSLTVVRNPDNNKKIIDLWIKICEQA